MALETKPVALSLAIPPTPTAAQMATETTVDGISPLKYHFRPRQSVRLDTAGAHADPVIHLKVEDVASTDVVAMATLLESMKGTLNQATRAFDFVAGDVKVVDNACCASTVLEDQTTQQKTEVQELRVKLRGEVRIGPKIELCNRLISSIQELVEQEAEDWICYEPNLQISQNLQHKLNVKFEYNIIAPQVDDQFDLDTPPIYPQEDTNPLPKIPILLYEDATDDEVDCYEIYQQNSCPTLNTATLFPPTENVYTWTKMQSALFDEPNEHEPPPPSPAPVAGPIRFLLRPLPTPEQSPTYVVRNTLPSAASSCCATPSTAYPRVPVPTPTTNEPTFMVLPINSAPVSALTPNPSSSPRAPRDANLLFALSSERNRELLRHHDLDGFVVPTPMAAWPKTRTVVKTPRSLRASPLMIPPPLETTYVDVQRGNRTPKFVPETPAETPVLFVPPPRPGPRAGNSFTDNLKLLPPLVIT